MIAITGDFVTDHETFDRAALVAALRRLSRATAWSPCWATTITALARKGCVPFWQRPTFLSCRTGVHTVTREDASLLLGGAAWMTCWHVPTGSTR